MSVIFLVSDSVTQFLLAENLANTTATEGEILTSLNTGQPQYKQTVLLNRPQRTGMSALSLEEHKVLQSLDRLNQRLQSKYAVDFNQCSHQFGKPAK